jgi:hypothetical protein
MYLHYYLATELARARHDDLLKEAERVRLARQAPRTRRGWLSRLWLQRRRRSYHPVVIPSVVSDRLGGAHHGRGGAR